MSYRPGVTNDIFRFLHSLIDFFLRKLQAGNEEWLHNM